MTLPPPFSLPSWFLRRAKRENAPIPADFRAGVRETGLQRIGCPRRQIQSGPAFSGTQSCGPVSKPDHQLERLFRLVAEWTCTDQDRWASIREEWFEDFVWF
jgi:hypothetical protein